MKRNVVLFISMTLDGFIATQDNDLSFLNIVDDPDEDYGYKEFLETIDTIVIGRKTFDKIISMGFDYSGLNKEITVVSRSEYPATGNLNFFNGNLTDLISELKSKTVKKIYCDGGAEIVNELLIHHCIDEMIISIIPVLLGEGIRLFQHGRPFESLKLVSSKAYNKGLVQLHYLNTGP